jgi:hypothetical protein
MPTHICLVAGKVQLPGWEDPQVDVCKVVCEWLNETEDVPWLMILGQYRQYGKLLIHKG